MQVKATVLNESLCCTDWASLLGCSLRSLQTAREKMIGKMKRLVAFIVGVFGLALYVGWLGWAMLLQDVFGDE